MTYDDADTARRGEITLHSQRSIDCRAMVREVLLDRRIEISIGTCRSRGRADRRLLTAVFDDRLGALRVEASQRCRERRAEAAVGRRRGDDFDHPAQLAS